MRVHHLNCGSMCPVGKKWLTGHGDWLAPAHLCCHCLLIEGRHGLILVDTGLGTADVADPRHLGGLFNHGAKPRLHMAETALYQIRELGLDPRDVRHIVVTHLDLDHAGGIADFPRAQVHVYGKEIQAALASKTWRERQRYVPSQWGSDTQWAVHETVGERWFGFESTRALPHTDEQVLLVPLIGHTSGHCGVAVRTQEGWLLHCGDAYFYRGEIDENPTCPIGLKALQRLLAMDNRSRLSNQQRLRELKYRFGDVVTLTSAHDPLELSLLASTAEYKARNERADLSVA